MPPSTTESQTKRRPSICAELQQNWPSPSLSEASSLLAFSNLRHSRTRRSSGSRDVESLRHKEAKRRHIATAELEGFVAEQEKAPQTIRWPRNTDLDLQLVWRGKDGAEDLAVEAVPIYIQEKIKPEVIIADLKRRSDDARRERAAAEEGFIPDMFADFNGLPEKEAELEF